MFICILLGLWILSLIIKEITKAKEQGAREEREKITKEVAKEHEDLHDLIIDKPGYDAYSDDYKHGILTGFTLVERYLDSLK